MKCAIVILCLAVLAGPAGAQMVAVQDVQSDFAKGDYRVVVDKTSRLFSSSTQEPQSSEKYKLLMLRGESQLQLKDRLGAMATFKSAAKLADDVSQYAVAKANALIVERSSMGRFTPRSGPSAQAIDILPVESRKQAMTALQADIWSQNKTQIQAALRSDTLPAIEKAFVPLSDMFCLETQATGRADETGTLMRDLGQHTYSLMQTDVTRLSRRVEQLNQVANSSSGGYGNWSAGRQGLTSTERNELKDASVYLAKVRDRATEYHGLASKLGGNEQRWDSMVLDITDTLAAADSLINNP